MSGISITNGPSKFDLMQSLFVRKPTRPYITFVLEDNRTTMHCFVNSVESEDNSGSSWNIAGFFRNNEKFKAYYRTDKRTGTYTVLDQE